MAKLWQFENLPNDKRFLYAAHEHSQTMNRALYAAQKDYLGIILSELAYLLKPRAEALGAVVLLRLARDLEDKGRATDLKIFLPEDKAAGTPRRVLLNLGVAGALVSKGMTSEYPFGIRLETEEYIPDCHVSGDYRLHKTPPTPFPQNYELVTPASYQSRLREEDFFRNSYEPKKLPVFTLSNERRGTLTLDPNREGLKELYDFAQGQLGATAAFWARQKPSLLCLSQA